MNDDFFKSVAFVILLAGLGGAVFALLWIAATLAGL